MKLTEEQLLRDKLVEIEAELKVNRAQLDRLTARQSWLAEQRSDCLKAIARLTLARTADLEA